MIKSILCAAALAAIAPAALAQATAPTQDHSGHAAPATTATPTINSSIKDLLANPASAAVLEKHLPGVANHPMRPQFEEMTLGEVMPMSQGAITQATIDAIDADLKALPAA